ncbi:MAG: class I SAM-dependent methyltransferase [Candidatus Pacearchaeota archaeon]|jgi:2-polyprenyl-3-methyl-5-hydroxy-6-metoxy-1,4-benzoquinol methylase
MKVQYQREYFNEFSEKQEKVFKKYLEFMSKRNICLKKQIIGDIGCGRGSFLKNLIPENICYGFDISEYAINECKKINPQIKNNFQFLDLNKSKINKEIKFDIITLFDVVEHLDNLSNLKAIIKNNLKNKGFLVITTPNANSFLRFLLKNKDYNGEIDKTHSVLFTPYTLDFFLRRSGLKKVTLSTPYSFYFKNNILTEKILFGGQIFAIYKKC